MSETFDPTLRRVYIPTGDAPPAPAAEDNPYVPVGSAPAAEQPPTWYGRASNALLSLLDQVGVAGLPEGEHRERVKTARNKLLHIGPMEEQDYLWPERMVRSAVTLPGDVLSGNVPPPGLRREDYTDVPADPDKVGGQPHDDLIQRVQDLAGFAMTGGLAGTGQGGMVVGSGPVRSAPVPKTEKPAPVWYSPVEHALEATTNARATGAQWLATLRNSRGVKPEELDWTGLRQYLEERADQPVSRPELHEYLRDNRVELQDVTKGAQDPVAVRKQAEEELRSAYGAREWRRFSNEEREDLIIEHMEGLQSEHAPEGSTKYHSYQLPGGENYREHLITMPIQGRRIGVRPSEEGPLEAYDTATGRTVRNSRGDDNEMLAWAEAENKKGQPTDPREYKSPHWDEPNIVAHVRSNVREMARDREVVSWRNKNSGNESQTFPSEEAAREWLATQRLPTDKLELVKRKLNEPLRSLHLEEVQSDWHQAGRRKGYKDENSKAARDEAYNKWSDAYEKNPHSEETKQLRQLYEEAQQHHVDSAGGVPDAPWKKTWHELALRRMIRLAAEEGMDRISWTPGEAQAARYDLSKSIDRVLWSPEGKKFMAFDKQGKPVIEKSATAEELPNIIGKEAADKLINKPTKINDLGRAKQHVLENADLKVGGEGMRGFYDKMMVQAAEKLGKEYGVKVVRGNIPDGRRVNKTVDDRYSVTGDSKIYETRAEAEKAASQSIWYFDIPPAMREAVLSKGMPLFSGGKMFVPSGAQRSESDGRD